MRESKLINPGKWYAEFDENGNCTKTVYDTSYRILLGYGNGEEYSDANETWVSGIHPDDRDRLEDYFRDFTSRHPEGMDFDIEYRMMTKSGYHWFHDYAHTTRRRDGSPIRADGAVFDIQEGLDKVDIIRHEKLKSDIFAALIRQADDPVGTLRAFAPRIREVLDCDQVIYRDTKETRIMENSPGIGEDWSVPIGSCRQCEHFDAHHPMYREGFTEMSDCREGWQGIPVSPHCPIRSSLTRIVYCDGEAAGYIAIHYIRISHSFTDLERATLADLANILSMSLSRYEARKRAGEVSSIKKTLSQNFVLSDQFDPIMVVDPRTGEYDWLMSVSDNVAENTAMSLHGDDFYRDIGVDTATIIHPDTREQFRQVYSRENLLRIAETGEVQETEHQWFIRDEGRYRWKYNKLVRMEDENGRAFVVVGVIDTTEAKKKEEELRRQKRQLEEQRALAEISERFFALEDSFESLYDVDLDSGRYTSYIKGDFYRQAVQEKLVAPGDYFEDLRANIDATIFPEDREGLCSTLTRDAIRRELSDNAHFDYYYRLNEDPKPLWFKMRIVYRDAARDHVIIGVFNAENDIEAKQLTEQKEQLEKDMQMIGGLASGYNALYYINIDEHLFTIYALDETKYPGSESVFEGNETDFYRIIRGYGLSGMVHPDDRQLFQDFGLEWIREKLTGRKKYSVRFRAAVPGGYRWDEMELTKYEDADVRANAVAVGFTDRDSEIRREQEYQQQLEEARQAADHANRSKTDFLFTMSHDIRTPMNAIRGFTTMAKKNVEQRERVIEYLDKIDISGQQLLTLINQVLEMARIESGKIEFEEKPINIREEFCSMVTVLDEQARSNGLSFAYSLDDISHNNVLADEARMNSVTLNIVGNAMKYTPSGGHVEFRLREIPCDRAGYGRYTFTVIDTGIGMSREFIRDLYKPFSREKTSTVSRIQGTGLGLSIVKNIIDLMGGRIEVESEPGKGTRFDITVDFRIDREARPEPGKAEKPGTVSFKGRRVLLVEDNEMNREIARDILEEQGLIVEDAEDGDVAVAMVQSVMDRGEFHYYDFILMDVQMPRMTGYEATKLIRAIPGTEGVHIPIIATTANAFEEDRRNALAAGMDDHLSKPLDIQKLFLTIARFL